MKTIKQRIASKQGWSTNGLAAHIDLDVMPLHRAAEAAIEKDGPGAMFRLGLRNRKRAKTVKLAIGVTAAIVNDGYVCEVSAADVLTACEDELAAVHALLSGAVTV
jgi:hypothetical protein